MILGHKKVPRLQNKDSLSTAGIQLFLVVNHAIDFGLLFAQLLEDAGIKLCKEDLVGPPETRTQGEDIYSEISSLHNNKNGTWPQWNTVFSLCTRRIEDGH